MKTIAKIYNIYSNLQIKYKLFLVFYPATSLIIIILGIVSFNIAADAVLDKSLNVVLQAAKGAVYGIEEKIAFFSARFDEVYYSKYLSDIIYSREEEAITQLENYNSFTRYVNSIMASASLRGTRKGQNGVYITVIRYNNFGTEAIPNNFHEVFGNNNEANLLLNPSIDQDNIQILNQFDVEKTKWYQNLKRQVSAAKPGWLQFSDDKKFNNISLVRELIDTNSFKKNIGMLIVTVKLEDIFNTLELFSSGSAYSYLIFDNKNELLFDKLANPTFSTQEGIFDFLQKDARRAKLKNGTIIFKNEISLDGWKMVCAASGAELTKDAKRIGTVVIIGCVLSLLLILFLSVWIASSFSRRINQITKYIKRFQTGNLDIKMTSILNDEIGFLSNAFNDMVAKWKSMLGDIHIANSEKKNAEFKALQAQINPHFLYNSLSSINHLAKRGMVEQTETIVAALVKFYRMTLNSGREIITVDDELNQVKAYITVMNVRMGEEFTVDYEINKDILNYKTIKLILQPFVENIFEHAIHDRIDPISIQIYADKTEKEILFKISDNGIGMDENKIAGIFQSTDNTGYGVRNVDDRIKIQYGQDYGVSYKSIIGNGTTVFITIPILD